MALSPQAQAVKDRYQTAMDAWFELAALAGTGTDARAAVVDYLIKAAAAQIGTPQLPAGTFTLASTLHVGPGQGPAGADVPPGFYGSGSDPWGTVFRYTGANGTAAIQYHDGCWDWTGGRFQVQRVGTAKTAVGLLFSPTVGGTVASLGTCLGGFTLEKVKVDNFSIGFGFGNQFLDPADSGKDWSVSEVYLNHVTVTNCDKGMTLRCYNTLNFTANNLGLSGNTIGCYAPEGGFLTVLGGTATNNSQCTFYQQATQNLVLIGFRNEFAAAPHTPLFAGFGSTNPATATFIGCAAVGGNPNADAPSDIYVQGGRTTVIGGYLEHGVLVGAADNCGIVIWSTYGVAPAGYTLPVPAYLQAVGVGTTGFFWNEVNTAAVDGTPRDPTGPVRVVGPAGAVVVDEVRPGWSRFEELYFVPPTSPGGTARGGLRLLDDWGRSSGSSPAVTLTNQDGATVTATVSSPALLSDPGRYDWSATVPTNWSGKSWTYSVESGS